MRLPKPISMNDGINTTVFQQVLNKFARVFEFRPLNVMYGIGYFQNLRNFLRNCSEMFWIFSGFWGEFFLSPFLSKFTFLSAFLSAFLSKFTFLSTFLSKFTFLSTFLSTFERPKPTSAGGFGEADIGNASSDKSVVNQVEREGTK